jgi:hypothetical protein
MRHATDAASPAVTQNRALFVKTRPVNPVAAAVAGQGWALLSRVPMDTLADACAA